VTNIYNIFIYIINDEKWYEQGNNSWNAQKMVEDAQKKIIEKQKKMQQIQQTVNKSSCGCNKR
jgi:hypothetical protein